MDMDKLVSLCKRRGFVFPSSEIYGGINGFWDYGPLGVELKRNIKDAWWKDNVHLRDDMVGLDCSIIMHPKVWEASGHVGGFSDPMVDCRACQGRFRADQLVVLEVALDPERTPPNLVGKRVFFAGVGSETEVREAHRKGIDRFREKNAAAGDVVATTILELAPEVRTQVKCPNESCGQVGMLTEPRQFNLMFETYLGALRDESARAYLRPETAQGIFANFRNVVDTGRVKTPFGIAQVGKSFRNEINPRNFTFRSREFEQMEIEFFCHPEEASDWYSYWRKARFDWYTGLGLRSEKLRLRDHGPEELAFYSTATADIEYEFPFGVSELEGIAHRGHYDLSRHQQFSGKDLGYFDEERWERDKAGLGMTAFKDYLKRNEGQADPGYPYQYVPHVIEPSAGADRATLAFLCEAYTEDEVGGEARTVLRFHPRLAPIKAAVFPLVRKDGMPEKAQAIYRDLKAHWPAFYDEKGAIGRRYRRQDEAGTPFCITVDGQTLQDDTVTLRDRDSCRQWRLPASGLSRALGDLIEGRSAPPEG